MADKTQKLQLIIEALDRTDKGLSDVRKHLSDTEKSAGRLRTGFDGLAASWKQFAAGAAVFLAGRAVLQTADEYQLLNNKLKPVTESAGDLHAVQQGLYEQALRSHSGYGASVDLYARFARASESLGTSQGELLRIVETVNKAFIVSGATQTEAKNAIIQLSQGMAAGALRGEEFNSIMEQGIRVAKMLADYLHTDVGGLRRLAMEGKITSEIIVGAFSESARTIDDEFARMQPTIAQAMTDLRTVFGRLIADSDQAAGGTNQIAAEISNLASIIDRERDGIIELLSTMLSLAGKVIEAFGNIGQSIRGWSAVKRGDLGFFEFSGMNAEELDAWLKAYDGEASRIQQQIDRKTAELRSVIPRGTPAQARGQYADRIQQLKDEIAVLNAAKVDLAAKTAASDQSASGAAGSSHTGDAAAARAEAAKKAAADAQKAWLSWSDTARGLNLIIDGAGLDEFDRKMLEISARYDSLREKAQGLPGEKRAGELDRIGSAQTAEEAALIDEWYAQFLKDNAAAAEAAQKQAEETNQSILRGLQEVNAEREASIEAQLAELDLAESAGTYHRATLDERIRLLNELRATQESALAATDKSADPASWYAQADAIRRTRSEIAGLQAELNPVQFALNQYAEECSDVGRNLADAWTGAFRGMEDALVEFVQTGKLNFSDLADSIIEDLIRIMIQKNITGPLAEGMSSGSLFSSIGSFFGFHSGGMGSEPTFVRLAPNPALLPRYHGGLGPGERYSITRDDEMILTPGQQKRVIELARGAAGGVTNNIHIVNNSGAEVQTEERPNGQGGVDLEVMIGNIAAKQLSTRGTYANKAIRQNYGMRERLIQR